MIQLYYHCGSGNHGCEAIVRSTARILNEPIRLFSSAYEEDEKYGINKNIQVLKDTYNPVRKNSLLYIKAALSHKLNHDDYYFYKYGHADFLKHIHKNDICFSIGGDNYCYPGNEILGYYNRMIHDKGAKTVLWGCSVEPSVLTEDIVKDLKQYDLITVRESLTQEALAEKGIIDNVQLYPDPAFLLETKKTGLPEGFSKDTTIGLNISPLVEGLNNLVYDNYKSLVTYILNETNYNILLVPHVVKKDSDDRIPLKRLMAENNAKKRIQMAEDRNCMELKGLISNCRFFIGARTHSTIAAYSSCVPTLAVGYSIKARGLAKDIFGSEGNYVLPLEQFKQTNTLIDRFTWLEEHEAGIKNHLNNNMENYSEKAWESGKAIRELMKDC